MLENHQEEEENHQPCLHKTYQVAYPPFDDLYLHQQHQKLPLVKNLG